MTLTRAAAGVRHYVSRAPATFIWLVVLTITTYIISRFHPAFRDHFLRQRSTNLHELGRNPIRVLVSSAMWIDGGGLWIYYLLYNLFHVPVERILGTGRWLVVVISAHVGATYLSEGVVYWEVSHGYMSSRAIFTLDVGVSYALAGSAAVLAFLMAKPWCYLYGGMLLAFYAYNLITGDTFTDLGHFTAVLIGFSCYPLTRITDYRWDPIAVYRSLRARAAAKLSQ
ncbi:rhomboid-like protein [Actinospica robiniae]|uniref:rhomboid-like protein n=1 Tax=Actinospica robiniae TaxID=304901 RepID=UPI0003F734C1|nr:rhomboid-like protein [Actinospica robiniae]